MSLQKGVLDKNYAWARKRKPELIFRYRVRAALIKTIMDRYLSGHRDLQILDFGSAEGLTLLQLCKYFPNAHFTGVEYSRELLQTAPPLPSNIHLCQGDISNLDDKIRSKKYDLVTALAVLEHLETPEKALQTAHSVLKPGGLFVATVPSPLWDQIATRLGLLQDHHESSLNKKSLRELFIRSGYKGAEYGRFMWAPVSALPYLHISVSPVASLKIDAFIYKLWVLNWLYVNQFIIAKR
ncbi:MAG: class I SAM-dependent methyltransferase [candidate division KSB1 bacterium]|nr:class I SAM-dependent methyltransferase [candidate division KSB1 bacterium]